MIALPKPVAVPIRYAPKTMKAKMAMGASFHFRKCGMEYAIKITLFNAVVNEHLVGGRWFSSVACV